jgi:hypothetical protein
MANISPIELCFAANAPFRVDIFACVERGEEREMQACNWWRSLSWPDFACLDLRMPFTR